MGARVVAVAAVLVLAGAAHAAAPPPAVVTNFGDDGPGSLRQLVRDAKPNQTITFAGHGTAVVDNPVHVQVSVTISGGGIRYGGGGSGTEQGASAGVLDVSAPGTTIRDVTFADGSLGVHRSTDVVVEHNTFIGRRSMIILQSTAGTRIARNTFSPSQPTAISYLSDDGLSIEDNEFSNTGREAIDGVGGRVTVRGNTFNGTISHVKGHGLLVEGNHLVDTAVLQVADAGDGKAIVARGNSGSGNLIVYAGRTATVAGQDVTVLFISCQSAWHGDHDVSVQHNVVHSRATVDCDDGTVHMTANTFGGGVLVLRSRDVRVNANTISGAPGAGVEVGHGATVHLAGTTITGNHGAGILVHDHAVVLASRLRMGGNGGPGIARGGGAPPAPTLRYDRDDGRLHGVACNSCTVELYVSEDGAKAGNPGQGEGVSSLGTIRTGSDGKFVYPAHGQFHCPATGLVTATATRMLRQNPNTSAFARDASCSCVAASDFVIDTAQAPVPSTGFVNFGVVFEFPQGTTFGAPELTDTKTKAAPAADALGPTLKWELSVTSPNARGAGRVARDVHVTVTPATRGSATANDVKARWHVVVPFKPPAGSSGCPAVNMGAFLPPP